MLIIPAIDLKDGMCVRLYQGSFEKELFKRDPLQIALKFKEYGAKRIHIIDLDGAREGKPVNLDVALAIKRECGLEVELGGGIRNLRVLEQILSSGIDYAILSTWLLERKEALKVKKDRIIVSIDIDKDGFLKTHGWQKRTNIKGTEFLEDALEEGFDHFIITLTYRDGTLEGLDISLIESFTKYTEAKIIFAGGISSLRDIEAAKKLGAYGVVIGRAFYEGILPLEVIRDVG